ncbi:MAG: CNNM domain-containing protein [Bacteroidales bacterium]|nr:CNNM domain-containing protein [Bacteroidales bacterium]
MGIGLILLLICSALISGSEVAYFSLTPQQIDSLKKKKSKKDGRILGLLRSPDYLLGTILQMNDFINIIIILVSTTLLSMVFDFSGHPAWGFIVNTVLVTFVLVLFGEVLPKLIAAHDPLKFARRMSSPLKMLMPFARPFNLLMCKVTNTLASDTNGRRRMTLEDLANAVDLTSSSAGDEKKILKGIVNLPSTPVIDIMKPRVDVIALDIKMSNEEVVELAINCGYSRLPVYRETLDDIRGFLYIKDVLPYVLYKSKDFNWRHHIREAYFVPENKKINDLLEELRARKMHLAVVVDEYGGTDGIVTLEDILEEIIGDIEDESDHAKFSREEFDKNVEAAENSALKTKDKH